MGTFLRPFYGHLVLFKNVSVIHDLQLDVSSLHVLIKFDAQLYRGIFLKPIIRRSSSSSVGRRKRSAAVSSTTANR